MTWLDLLEEAKQKLSPEERQQLALALWQSLDPPALPDDEIHPLTPEPMTGAEIVAAGLTGTLPDLPEKRRKAPAFRHGDIRRCCLS